MFCTICRGAIAGTNQLTLPTTDGHWVHLACAEREAHVAQRARTIRAIASTGLVVGMWELAFRSGMDARTLVALIGILFAMHIRINSRWWHYAIQSARLWWRWW